MKGPESKWKRTHCEAILKAHSERLGRYNKNDKNMCNQILQDFSKIFFVLTLTIRLSLNYRTITNIDAKFQNSSFVNLKARCLGPRRQTDG